MKSPLPILPLVGFLLAGGCQPGPADPTLQASPPGAPLRFLGSFRHGGFDKGASEIAAYDPTAKRLYVVNGESRKVDVLNIADPANPTRIESINLGPGKTSANSVAFSKGILAIAVQADPKTAPGKVVLIETATQKRREVTVGSQPDMVTFTPDGRYVLTANEGEPDDEYQVNPEGSVSIVEVATGSARMASFQGITLDKGVRIFGPQATPAQDLEPEYIAIAPDGKTAYVTLQENNAIAVLDIAAAKFTNVHPLGAKDFAKPGNELGEFKGGAVTFASRPVFGNYQPDSIAFANGYLYTANEGDARAWGPYQEEEEKGGFAVSQVDGQLFGARSLSVWSPDGKLIWDSGSEIERATAKAYPDYFNVSNTKNKPGARDAEKGPEPEGLAIGEIDGHTYAFVGLERIGGVVVYDLADPAKPKLRGYVNRRDFEADPKTPEALDLGPEGIHFIAAKDSPNGKPMLVVCNEVSGTTSLFEVTP
jgi:DNA-binding beta-propeller fold protein YncE